MRPELILETSEARAEARRGPGGPTHLQILVLITLVSVALRLASAVLQGDRVAILPGIDDQISYHSLAIRVLGGHGFTFGTSWWPATRANEPTAHWSFLYTLYLVGVYGVAGVHPLVARLVQAVAVGVLQPVLTWRLGRRVFGPRIGLVAAALAAGYVYFFYYAGALMTESFYIVAILWTLDLTVSLGRGLESPALGRPRTWMSWLALGTAVGSAVLLRQLFLLVAPIFALWLLAVRRRRLRERGVGLAAAIRPTVLGLLLSGAVVVLLIAPWTVRNYRAFGRFVPLNTNSGYVLFWGNNPVYGNSFVPILSDEEYRRLIPTNLRGLDEAALDQALLREGIGFIVADPARYALLSISRVKAYFEFWPEPDSGLASNLARVLSFGICLPFMVVGLYRSARDRRSTRPEAWRILVLLYLFMAAYALIHLLTWALIRYRLPIDALLVLFAARALDPLLLRLGERRRSAPGPPNRSKLKHRRRSVTKVLVLFGTRPEAIKMAPIVANLAQRGGGVESITCVTAQHRQMLDQVLGVFGIAPDYDLDLMRDNQTLASLTSLVLDRVSEVLRAERPDVVLVQGDTTTAMAAGLAAFYEQVPVGHVEAGLRTGLRYRPFPEEINRRLVSELATYHFAPTRTAAAALFAEGIPASDVFVTGNTVIDALHQMAAYPHRGPLPDLRAGHRLILITAHRRENFGQPLEDICTAVLEIVGRYPEVEVAYPVHLNPRVQSVVRRRLGDHPRVHLLEPLDYLDFLQVLKQAYLVLTDSGGIQEEAPALGKPVLVLRTETERPEAVTAGTVKLVGTDADRIISETRVLLDDWSEYQRMARSVSPYGDGHAAERIVNVILGARAGRSPELAEAIPG